MHFRFPEEHQIDPSFFERSKAQEIRRPTKENKKESEDGLRMIPTTRWESDAAALRRSEML